MCLENLDYTKYPNIMICGDFNSHHIFWDPSFSSKDKGEGDVTGKMLYNCIQRHNIKILNDKRPTCREGNTLIDLALTKGIGNCQLVSYTDTRPILNTIHNPIIVKVGKITNKVEVKYNTNISPEELELWKDTLKSKLEDWKNEFPAIETSEQIREKMTEKFIESIENSVKQHFKLKKICAYSKPWMNDHVKKLLKSSGNLKE